MESEEDSRLEDYDHHLNNQSSLIERRKSLEQNYEKKIMQELNNEIEQEVSILVKNHYMLQLNIQIPPAVLDFADNGKKEAYLQIFQEEKKSLIKKIDELSRNNQQLIKLQALLYESTVQNPRSKGERDILKECAKQDAGFAQVLSKLEDAHTHYQCYIDHFSSFFTTKQKNTFHHDSTPVSIQEEYKIFQQDQVIEPLEDKETGISTEEMKESNNAHDASSYPLKNIVSSGINSSTQLVSNINPKETIMTRSKVQQMKSNSVIETSDNMSVTSAKNELTPPIKRQNQIEHQTCLIGSEKSVNNSYLPSLQCGNPYSSAKTLQSEKMKEISALNNTNSNISQFNQFSASNQAGKNSKSFGNGSVHIDSAMRDKSSSQITNGLIIQNTKIYNQMPTKKVEEIIIKTDYEDQQDKLKNYHMQFKLFNEKMNVQLEEIEHIIHMLKIYMSNHCFSQQKSNFYEVQTATASQLDKCVNFLSVRQQFEEQVCFIENQFLYFPNSSDLTFECRKNLKSKLNISKQILLKSERSLKKQKNNMGQPININDNSQDSSADQDECTVNFATKENNGEFSYINSLKQFYLPNTGVVMPPITSLEATNSIQNFQKSLYQKSQLFFKNINMSDSSRFKFLKSSEMINQIKNEDSLKKLFSI